MILRSCALQDVVDFIADQSELLTGGGSSDLELASLRGGTLLAGDLLYIPPCSLIVEKAVKADNVGLRSACCFFNKHAQEVFKRYLAVHSTCLQINAKMSCLVLCGELLVVLR